MDASRIDFHEAALLSRGRAEFYREPGKRSLATRLPWRPSPAIIQRLVSIFLLLPPLLLSLTRLSLAFSLSLSPLSSFLLLHSAVSSLSRNVFGSLSGAQGEEASGGGGPPDDGRPLSLSFSSVSLCVDVEKVCACVCVCVCARRRGAATRAAIVSGVCPTDKFHQLIGRPRARSMRISPTR